MGLKLGLNLGYWGIGPQGDDATEIVLAAERFGFDSVWAAESYGSDVVRVLSFLAQEPREIQTGSSILQVPARQPAAAAMAGITIDALSGGRFMFGFGPSGPQVSEGWYGVPYEKPWGRTREYVEIVKQVVARDGRLEYEGKHFKLPLAEGEGVTGQGKALKLNVHPIRNEIPIYLGAIGRKSVELAAEVADGWIPIFFSVDKWEDAWGEHIEAGLSKSGRSREDFAVSPSVQVAIDGDLDAAHDLVKAGLLLYLGGMGSKKTNFNADLTRRFGFAEVADEVQSLYLEGKREEAYAAIPDELVDATAMIGTEDEVADRVKRFADAGVDRMIVSPMHGNPDENVRCLEKLAGMVGAGAAV